MYSGNLEKDSPSTFKLVKQSFAAAEIQQISSIYAELCENPKIRKELELRPEGQSFNPRPARIIAILLQDADINDYKIIIEALSNQNSQQSIIQEAVLLDDIRHYKLYSLELETLMKRYKKLEGSNSLLAKKLATAVKLYLK